MSAVPRRAVGPLRHRHPTIRALDREIRRWESVAPGATSATFADAWRVREALQNVRERLAGERLRPLSLPVRASVEG